jgi:hypothetical protein
MYWYLKNLHNETISGNNLDEISHNFTKFCKRKYNKILRNFTNFREIKITFVVICISWNTKILLATTLSGLHDATPPPLIIFSLYNTLFIAAPSYFYMCTARVQLYSNWFPMWGRSKVHRYTETGSPTNTERLHKNQTSITVLGGLNEKTSTQC